MNCLTFESALLYSRTVNNRSTNHSEGSKRVYLLKPSARVIWRFESGAWANIGSRGAVERLGVVQPVFVDENYGPGGAERVTTV